MKISMKTVFYMRKLVYEGFSVKEISEIVQTSESTVLNYTKAERKFMKERKAV